MQYVGSKRKLVPYLTRLFAALRQPGQLYVEPCMGSCAVAAEVPNPRVLSDANLDLVLMTKAFVEGRTEWPYCPDEQTHREWKMRKSSAERGWVGVVFSYRARFFHTYNYLLTPDKVDRMRLRAIEFFKQLQGAEILHRDYFNVDLSQNALIYCDPPYAGTATYPGTLPFDHFKFWQWVAEASKGNLVFVSEYVAPKEFVCVKKFWTTVSLARNIRAEKLYVHPVHAERVLAAVADLDLKMKDEKEPVGAGDPE